MILKKILSTLLLAISIVLFINCTKDSTTEPVINPAVSNFVWTKQAGGTNPESVSSIAVDAQGNRYVAGSFWCTAQLGTITVPGGAYATIFVAKMDSSNNWIWADQACATNDLKCKSISVDESGNTYITGTFSGQAQFGTTFLYDSGNNGNNDIFVAKMSANGNWLWAVRAGGSAYDCGYGLALDNQNNLSLTGVFQGIANFGTISLTSAGSADVFIAKIDTNGNWLWAKQAGGTVGDCAFDIAIGSDNSAYLTGIIAGTAIFGATSLTVNGDSGNTFIAKIDTDGEWLWAKKVDGTSNYGLTIAIDNQNDIYLSGAYNTNAIFGTTSLTESDNRNIYLAKMSRDGNWLWANKTDNAVNSENSSIAVDENGNVYLATNTLISTTTTSSNGSTTYKVSGFYLAKADANGTWLWNEYANEGYPAGSYAATVVVDSKGSAYVGGHFSGSVAFGKTLLNSVGGNDIFIAKIK